MAIVADAPDAFGRTVYKAWWPTYTNITVGNGTVVARYVQNGKIVHAYFSLTFGSTTSVTGSAIVSPPVAMSSSILANMPVGVAILFENGVTTRNGTVFKSSGAELGLYANDASSAYVRMSNVNATVPFTWGTDDFIRFSVTYEAA